MAKGYDNFTDAALIEYLVSTILISRLVDRGVISAAVAADVFDETLLRLEEWQALFPRRYKKFFELARGYLAKALDDYRSISKK